MEPIFKGRGGKGMEGSEGKGGEGREGRGRRERYQTTFSSYTTEGRDFGTGMGDIIHLINVPAGSACMPCTVGYTATVRHYER